MLYSLLKAAHVLAIVAWVGGMLFAHAFLRPAVQALAPAQRLPLMQQVLQRFLAAAGVSVLVVLATGGAMLWLAVAGGATPLPHGWIAMTVLGLLMAAVYGHVRFVLYPRLAQAVARQDWPAGGAVMAQFRRWVGANLVLGGIVIVVALVPLP